MPVKSSTVSGFRHQGYYCKIQKRDEDSWLCFLKLNHPHPWHRRPLNEIKAEVPGGINFGGKHGELYYIGFRCDGSLEDAESAAKSLASQAKKVVEHVKKYKKFYG